MHAVFSGLGAVPSEHVAQEEPSPAVPSPHSEQASSPIALEVPGEQLLHEVLSGDGTVPSLHGRQTDEPLKLIVPLGQSSQVDDAEFAA